MNKRRGWVSSNDPGTNTTYYLYLDIWFHMITPDRFTSDNHASKIRVFFDGRIDTYWIEGSGGVQIISKKKL